MKIAIDAGHGMGTPGKETPDGREKEWFFNNQVALACIAKLKTFEGVEILLVSDPTGKSDTPLAVRTNQANHWRADCLVSIHHNADKGVWGSHGGVETYVQEKTASQASKAIATCIHPRIVKAMGLRDRGIKTENFHMTRETNMPSVLTEAGFMDSTTDIGALRDKSKLKAQGEAIAEGLADHFKLRPKGSVQYRVLTGTFKTKEAAEKAAADIKKQFGWVVYVRDE